MSDILKIVAALLGLIGFVLVLRALSGRFLRQEEEPPPPVFPETATPDLPLAELDAGHDTLWAGYFKGPGGLVTARRGLEDEVRHWREKLVERLEFLFGESGPEERGPILTLNDVPPELLKALDGRIGPLQVFGAGDAVLAALDDPSTRLSELSRIITGNPLLAGKVLSCVNSAYFGLHGEVASLPMAILILGMGNLRTILYRESLSHLAHTRDPRLRAFFDTVWEHLALTGVCCAHVAKAFAGVDAGTLFTMGLVHDLGRFVLATSPLADRGGAPAYDQRFTTQEENDLFGINHALAGRLLADRWNLPRLIAQGLEHHHAPAWADSLSLGLDDESVRHVAALFVADKLAGVFSAQEEHPEPLHASYHELVNRKMLQEMVLDPALARDIKKTQEMVLRGMRAEG